MGMVLAGIWPRSLVARSVGNPQFDNPADVGGPEYRGVEIPSANGIGQARAIAKTYAVLAGDGHELGISARTKEELTAPAATPKLGTRDAVLKMDTRYGFGFSRPSNAIRFGADHRAFGAPGAGGSFGMADPSEQLGYAYLTNKMGFRIFDDPREGRQGCLLRLPRGSASPARRVNGLFDAGLCNAESTMEIRRHEASCVGLVE